MTLFRFFATIIPMTNDTDKKIAELREKLRVATINAERAERRAIKAVRVIRNMSEAKAGLERAMNIF